MWLYTNTSDTLLPHEDLAHALLCSKLAFLRKMPPAAAAGSARALAPHSKTASADQHQQQTCEIEKNFARKNYPGKVYFNKKLFLRDPLLKKNSIILNYK